ncbi:EF-hand domain-containing protein [Shewanella sp. A14]
MNRYLLLILLACLTILLSVNAIGIGNGGMGNGGMGNGGMGNGGMGMSQRPVFSDFDTNQDELISEEEFEQLLNTRQELRKSDGRLLKNSSRSDDMFERIDLNNDGFIDAKEFQTHRDMMRSSK